MFKLPPDPTVILPQKELPKRFPKPLVQITQLALQFLQSRLVLLHLQHLSQPSTPHDRGGTLASTPWRVNEQDQGKAKAMSMRMDGGQMRLQL